MPNLNWSYGWVSADLTIQGLKAAGPNPTRPDFLSAVRDIKGYTGGGLMAHSVRFSLADFGKVTRIRPAAIRQARRLGLRPASTTVSRSVGQFVKS